INECVPVSPCHSNGACNNTEGSYICTCDSGYSGDGFTCNDINECLPASPCHVAATCNNTEGSYNCSCDSGYSGDGVTCNDINECLPVSPCHSNGACSNTEGTYNCVCNSGYSGDGFTCELVDNDVCSQTPQKCGEGQTCQNSLGTYSCICNSPGTLYVNGSCEAILTLEGGLVVQNRVYKATYNDSTSPEFMQFAEEVEAPLETLINQTKFASDSKGVRVTSLYNGSVGVVYLALFDPSTAGLTSSSLGSELEAQLNTTNNEKFLGALQLKKSDSGNAFAFTDYDECNPAESIHIPDCGPNATCTNVLSTYNCTCLEGYIREGTTCVGAPTELVQGCIKKRHTHTHPDTPTDKTHNNKILVRS
ncbi:c-binding -like isoform X1, partial [Paramuricea clavata]